MLAVVTHAHVAHRGAERTIANPTRRFCARQTIARSRTRTEPSTIRTNSARSARVRLTSLSMRANAIEIMVLPKYVPWLPATRSPPSDNTSA